ALYREAQSWVFDPNITMVDFGWYQNDEGLVEGDYRIRFHVRQKFEEGPQLESAIDEGQTSGEIPEHIGPFKRNVIESGYELQRWWLSWWRPRQQEQRALRADPLRGGISIGNEYAYDYGTLGALVVDRDTGKVMCLSNWHVLVKYWTARRGQRIYQPGRRDGGTSADTVASLERHAMSVNLDAAVAKLTNARSLTNDQLDIGAITGVQQPELGMNVVKSGRGSKITYGRISGIEGISEPISYSGTERRIFHMITIDQRASHEEVSRGGDSGSIWIDADSKQAIGLHFAGYNQPERALAMNIVNVLNALNVDLYLLS
ncbi:MAG: hypothetical protein PVH65_06625, partial [Chloroflexota bacterium]